MIIDEMGFFEWDGEDGNKSVLGHLTIEDSGHIFLKMHGSLGGEPVPYDYMAPTPLENKKIRGVLNRSAQKVLLTDLESYPVGITEPVLLHFPATRCFISCSFIEADAFNGLSLPLQGVDDWFSPGTIYAPEGSEDRMTLVIEKTPDYSWPLKNATLSLKSHIEGPFSPSKNGLGARLSACFELIREQVSPAQDLIDWFNGFQEFISLMVNAPYYFSWPTLLWEKEHKTHRARCYYPRPELFEQKTSTFLKCLPFGEIKDNFGRLFETWMSKKEELGPGTHLYLGTLRNPYLYLEHKFVSLVWGLEALDRRNADCIPPAGALARKAKADKIIQETCVNTQDKLPLKLDKDERKWLKNAINNAAERTLAERLFARLSPVAFDIDPERLTTFCETCASLRNRLSHTGGASKAGEYDAFLKEVIPVQLALMKLYHLVMLEIIGVEQSLLKWSMQDSLYSFDFQYCLRRAELITREEFINRKGPAALKHA